ncbi:putative movement protein 2 [Trailing lespedeza virus 1]|uniref:Movement protein 2 n=2 Tax=Trailing lespedeza virus 1 TaxID=944580 RepID=F1BA32_9TOMB|nr:putative movement protein 2 [Trailing lespedeza virus 1]ADY69095.1 putative movement protein 2 [Trailing lespedeza virus 1]
MSHSRGLIHTLLVLLLVVSLLWLKQYRWSITLTFDSSLNRVIALALLGAVLTSVGNSSTVYYINNSTNENKTNHIKIET